MMVASFNVDMDKREHSTIWKCSNPHCWFQFTERLEHIPPEPENQQTTPIEPQS